MGIDHLQLVSKNRKKGAAKAAATRQTKLLQAQTRGTDAAV